MSSNENQEIELFRNETDSMIFKIEDVILMMLKQENVLEAFFP